MMLKQRLTSRTRLGAQYLSDFSTRVRAVKGAATLILCACCLAGAFAQSTPAPDELTEYSAHRWGYLAEQGNASLQNSTSFARVGASALLLHTTSPYRTAIFTPPSGNGCWDLSYTGGMAFWVYAENPNPIGFQNRSPWIRLYTSPNDYYELRPNRELLDDARGQWREIIVPFQNYDGWRMSQVGSPDLRYINRIEINTDTWDYRPYRLWIDGMRFNLPPFPAPNQMAIAGNNCVHLSWMPTSSPNFLRYEIYRSQQPFNNIAGMSPIATISSRTQTRYTDATAVNGRSYYYAVAVRLRNNAVSSEVRSIGPRTPYNETDLQVVSISRTPRYPRYDPIYNVREVREPSGFGPYITSFATGLGSGQNANTQRFPRHGDTVTYTARVRNRGTNPFSGSVTIRWFVDETLVREQCVSLSLQPGASCTYTYVRAWDSNADPRIRFTIVVNDARPANNTLAINAKSVAFLSYVDRSYLEEFRESSRVDWRATTDDFIDWLNRHMDRFNDMFALALSPKRVHYDVIEIIDDHQPDPERSDLNHFAMLPFRFRVDEYFYLRNTAYYSRDADADLGLLHEWGHQLGLIDLYRLNVDPSQNLVNGQPYRVVDCLMTNVAPFLSQHSAIAMTRWYNIAHGYYGQYLYELPAQHRMLFLDVDGRPLASARVTVYQLCERPGMGQVITNQVKAQGHTDANGYYILPNVPIDPNIAPPTHIGLQLRDNPYGYVHVVGTNGLLLMKIEKDGQTDWAWLSIVESNLAFWSGQTGLATFERRLRIRGSSVSLSSLSISPSSVVGGCSATGTVTLNAPAPSGGFVVNLSSSNSNAASVPTSVTVPAGQTRADFTITTAYASAQCNITITASARGVSRTATLTITPSPVLQSITLNPASLTGGQNSTGTVTLNCAAPSCGVVVQLSSSDPNAASVPASVTIPAGQSRASFTITTRERCQQANVTITASYGGVNRTAQLTVNPLSVSLQALEINPSSVTGGQNATGTVRLNCATPCPVTVQLSSSDPNVAQTPPSVTVPAGQSSASFAISTNPNVAATTTVSITASLNGGSRSAQLTVNPRCIPIQSVRLEPASPVHGKAVGGRELRLTVTLTEPAPYNMTVQLQSQQSSIIYLPSTMTIPAGQASATIVIDSRRVHSNKTVTVTAQNGCSSQSGSIRLYNTLIRRVEFEPNPVRGGNTFRVTIYLVEHIPDGGYRITIDDGGSSIVHTRTEITAREGRVPPISDYGAGTARVSRTTQVTITFRGANGETVRETITVRP